MELTEKRKREIALALVKYTAARKGFNVDAHDTEDAIKRSAKKIGIDSQKMREYALTIVIPAALSRVFSETIILMLSGTRPPLSDDEIGDISLKVIREDGMDLSPSTFQSRVDRIRKETGISEEELREFYIGFVLPYAIGKIAGWDSCSITGTSDKKQPS